MDNEVMANLTNDQRERSAAALDELLQQVDAGDVEATAGEATYIAGAVEGLRADLK